MADITLVPLDDLPAATTPLASTDLLLVQQGGTAKKVSAFSAGLPVSAIAAGLIFAGPASGAAAIPTFRALVADDIPSTLNATTFSGTATATHFLVGGSAVLEFAQQGTVVANGSLIIGSGLVLTGNTITAVGGSGSVTSVAETFTGGLISVGGSPITTAGTLALTVAGTSGGVVYFDSTSSWASSALLTANALMLGGGAGAAPSTPVGLGTTTTVLHGNAAGAPTWGAVSLTADVSGILPATNGGTGFGSFTAGTIPYAVSTSALAFAGPFATNSLLLTVNGGAPKVSAGIVSDGVAKLTLGGVGVGTGGITFLGSASGGVTFAIPNTVGGTYTMTWPASAGVSGQVLTSAGGGVTQMTWSNLPTGTISSIVAGGVLSGGTITTTGTVGLVAGTGLSGSAGSGTISNAGVLALVQGTITDTGTITIGGNLTLDAGGTLTAAASGTGTVTSVVAGSNLTGGTITSSGTIALSVTPTINDSTAKLILDRNSGGTLDIETNALIQLAGADTTNVFELIDIYSNTAASAAQFLGRKSRGTRAAKTALSNTSIIARFGGNGYDGTAYSGTTVGAFNGMSVISISNWTTADHGAALTWNVTPSGSTTSILGMQLRSTDLALAGGSIVVGGTIGSSGTITGGNTLTPGGDWSSAGSVAFSGAFSFAGTLTGNTSVTFPTSGTLSTTTGTVTSVAETFTGGIISVAGSPITSAGTLALTVTGTSGGIPVFTSGTSWASSTLLATNSIILGGGATVGVKTSAGIISNGVAQITLGAVGTGSGALVWAGTTSGSFTISVPNAVGGTVSMQWPASAGSAGQPMLSGGAGGQITIGTLGVAGGGTGLASWTTNTLVYASGTATLAGAVLPSGWAITSGTLVPSNTITVGLSNSLTDSITLGTYDLGPILQGGTVLNSYAHVASGTLTYTGAIGAPGTYTAITGMSAITSSSTTIDTIGTATAANVLSAGQHLWVVVGGTLAPGGTVFFTVKVP